MPSVRSSPRGYGRTRARNPLYRDCGEGRPKLITDLGPLLEEGDKSILPADPCPARDRLERKSSGRRRFQRPSKHVTERLGPPAAKALDVAGHNVEHTRGEARLDADDDVDGPAGRPAFVSPARSCSSVMTWNASGSPVISAMRPARSAPDRRSGPVAL